jgi:uncharacterized protein (DUF2345 family)
LGGRSIRLGGRSIRLGGRSIRLGGNGKYLHRDAGFCSPGGGKRGAGNRAAAGKSPVRTPNRTERSPWLNH